MSQHCPSSPRRRLANQLVRMVRFAPAGAPGCEGASTWLRVSGLRELNHAQPLTHRSSLHFEKLLQTWPPLSVFTLMGLYFTPLSPHPKRQNPKSQKPYWALLHFPLALFCSCAGPSTSAPKASLWPGSGSRRLLLGCGNIYTYMCRSLIRQINKCLCIYTYLFYWNMYLLIYIYVYVCAYGQRE